MSLRIVLVDNHPGWRRSLRGLLEREPGWSVPWEAGDSATALAAFEASAAQPPDVLLLDLDLGEGCGLSLCQQLLSRWPGLPILMLSWHDDLPLAQAAATAGCRGYVLKDDPPQELIVAIREVARGRRHFSKTLREDQRL